MKTLTKIRYFRYILSRCVSLLLVVELSPWHWHFCTCDDDWLSEAVRHQRFRRRRRVTCCALSPSPATSSLAKSAFASEDGDLGVKKPAVYAFLFKEERRPDRGCIGQHELFGVVLTSGPSVIRRRKRRQAKPLAGASVGQIAYTMSSRGDVTNFDVKIPDDIKTPKRAKQWNGSRHVRCGAR